MLLFAFNIRPTFRIVNHIIISSKMKVDILVYSFDVIFGYYKIDFKKWWSFMTFMRTYMVHIPSYRSTLYILLNCGAHHTTMETSGVEHNRKPDYIFLWNVSTYNIRLRMICSNPLILSDAWNQSLIYFENKIYMCVEIV